MCCHVYAHYVTWKEKKPTIAGKGNVEFRQYLFPLRVSIPTAVAQEQLPSLVFVDAIQLAFKQTYFVLLEQE